MHIKNLSLHSFRNYENASLDLSQGINLFVGDNAQGKTNLLEAIYVLSLSKSYRTVRETELIQHGAQKAMIKAEVAKMASLDLAVIISDVEKKRLLVNHKSTTANSFVGCLNTVLFIPDSLQLVKGSPGDRRRFLDVQICQIDPVYRSNLLKYQRVVRQRNSLLKEAWDHRAQVNQLPSWDHQLAALGAKIMLRRQDVVKTLQHHSQVAHETISHEREELCLIYQPFFETEECAATSPPYTSEELEVILARKITERRGEEIRRGYTLVGPQRDDLIFRINNTDLKKYGSQGQQRTAVLSYILAELELMCQETGDYPVVLLDDVTSELDAKRQMLLLSILNEKAQTIVTTTNLDSFSAEVKGRARVFTIEQGRIMP
ncbi:MAG: DNA replication/repair protein RecF [Limnochordia bacterium]|jgi:DNA replication and repair protein RecF|nr:DNA replication/repair protein RecF [Limnochordia bacterium]